MNHRSSTAPANPLEFGMGLAAGILGGIGLGVYVFVPSLTRSFCFSLGPSPTPGPCPVRSAVQFIPPVLVAALLQRWAPLFLVVAVGAVWDGWRRALLGRVLLWLATPLLLAVTVPGLFFGGNLYFVPGIVLALAASVAAVAYRR